jgi:uncharacterized protein
MATPAMKTAAAASPVATAARLETLDVVRGVAVLGILLMNIWAFAGPQAFFDYPVAVADWPGAPVATWTVVHTLFEGSQRALFSLLFGAGTLLLITRLTAAPGIPVARIYYRRIFLLIAIGLVDAFVLLWPADILVTYGLCGLLLYPLRRAGAPLLGALAAAVLALNAGLRVLELVDTEALRAAYPAALAGTDSAAQATVAAWERIESRAHPDINSEEFRASLRAVCCGDFREFYAERAKSSLILQTVVALNAWFLDALAVMLLGMAALRLGLVQGHWHRRWLVALMLVGYGVGLPLASGETRALLAADFDPGIRAQWLVVYDLRRIAIAAGHLGLVLLLCQADAVPWLRRKLSAVGRMALSNYLGQSLIGALIFYSVGLGLFGRYTGWHLYVFVGLIWILQIVASNWWLARFRFGPAEWLWRSLTYRQRQPFRRRPA